MRLADLHTKASGLRKAVLRKTSGDPGKGWALDRISQLIGFENYNHARVYLTKNTDPLPQEADYQTLASSLYGEHGVIDPEQIVIRGNASQANVQINGVELVPFEKAILAGLEGFAWGQTGQSNRALAKTLAEVFWANGGEELEERILQNFVCQYKADADFSATLGELLIASKKEG